MLGSERKLTQPPWVSCHMVLPMGAHNMAAGFSKANKGECILARRVIILHNIITHIQIITFATFSWLEANHWPRPHSEEWLHQGTNTRWWGAWGRATLEPVCHKHQVFAPSCRSVVCLFSPLNIGATPTTTSVEAMPSDSEEPHSGGTQSRRGPERWELLL